MAADPCRKYGNSTMDGFRKDFEIWGLWMLQNIYVWTHSSSFLFSLLLSVDLRFSLFVSVSFSLYVSVYFSVCLSSFTLYIHCFSLSPFALSMFQTRVDALQKKKKTQKRFGVFGWRRNKSTPFSNKTRLWSLTDQIASGLLADVRPNTYRPNCKQDKQSTKE